MDEIVFVVLHYKVIEITKECLDNLLQQNYVNYHILVIDNHSCDGSYEELYALYHENKHVEVITAERNYGFAKGNDIGYLIAKHKYNADYIIVMNNDVMIEDKEFCQKLVSSIYDDAVGVIGPDIINLKGMHQNPLKDCITTKSALNKAIIKTRIKIIMIPLLYDIVKNRKQVVDTLATETIKNEKEERNVPLHGSCLIFTKPFIDRLEYAFYPETFLYGEEEILYYISTSMNLETLYLPNLVVKHMEDVSTNSLFGKTKEKRLFELKNSLKSLQILKNLWN